MTGSRSKSKQQPKPILKKNSNEAPAASATTDAIIETTDDVTIDNNPVTKNYLEQCLKRLENSLNISYSDTIDKLQSTIETLTQSLNNCKKQCEKLTSEVRELKTENNKLKQNYNTQQTTINTIEERIEDRTNRQLRKTLVFRGIGRQWQWNLGTN